MDQVMCDAVRDIYAALNRNDIPAMAERFDAGVVRVEPAGFPSAGTYRGWAAVRAHFEKGRSTWAEGACEPGKLITAGDKVVAFLHVRVRLLGETEWREGDLADVFTFRGGKAIEMRTFADRQQALDWANNGNPESSELPPER